MGPSGKKSGFWRLKKLFSRRKTDPQASHPVPLDQHAPITPIHDTFSQQHHRTVAPPVPSSPETTSVSPITPEAIDGHQGQHDVHRSWDGGQQSHHGDHRSQSQDGDSNAYSAALKEVPIRPLSFEASIAQSELLRDIARMEVSRREGPYGNSPTSLRQVQEEPIPLTHHNQSGARNHQEPHDSQTSTSGGAEDSTRRSYGDHIGTNPSMHADTRDSPNDDPGLSHQGFAADNTASAEDVIHNSQSNTNNIHTSQKVAPAVTHENVTRKVHHVREEKIYKDIHEHEVVHRMQPIVDTEVLPTRHYILDADKTITEIDYPTSLALTQAGQVTTT